MALQIMLLRVLSSAYSPSVDMMTEIAIKIVGETVGKFVGKIVGIF